MSDKVFILKDKAVRLYRYGPAFKECTHNFNIYVFPKKGIHVRSNHTLTGDIAQRIQSIS